MATGHDIVSGALRLLGVRAAETPIEATEIQDGLESLNDMMSEWEEDGIYTGFVPLFNANVTLSVPASAIGSIKSMLAIYIAPEYDRVITPALAARARNSFITLRASLVPMQPSEYPDSLPIGSGNENAGIQTNGDKPNSTDLGRFYPANIRRNF